MKLLRLGEAQACFRRQTPSPAGTVSLSLATFSTCRGPYLIAVAAGLAVIEVRCGARRRPRQPVAKIHLQSLREVAHGRCARRCKVSH